MRSSLFRHFSILSCWLVVMVVMITGCALTHDAPPTYVCSKDEDCFTLEGEFCYRSNPSSTEPGECRRRFDSSVPDLPSFEASIPDAPSDAKPSDLDSTATDAKVDHAPADMVAESGGG